MIKHINIFLLSLIILSACVSQKTIFESKNLHNKPEYLIEIVGNDTIFYKKGEYQTDIKNGKIEIHLNNGDMVLGQYQDNKKHGEWQYYNNKKVLYKKEYYTEGFLSRIQWYNKNKLIKEVITDPTF